MHELAADVGERRPQVRGDVPERDPELPRDEAGDEGPQGVEELQAARERQPRPAAGAAQVAESAHQPCVPRTDTCHGITARSIRVTRKKKLIPIRTR